MAVWMMDGSMDDGWAGACGMSSGCFGLIKAGQNCSGEGIRGPLKSDFSGFIQFAADRISTGWALLFTMAKVSGEEFLYG
jgi:hypothetical protein